VIVVIGRSSGAAGAIARVVAQRGAAVELVAAVLPDAAGDRELAKAAGAGVGHAAVLRTAAVALEPPDVELALRYLPDVRVIVVADDGETIGGVAAEAAAWSTATLVLVTERDVPGLPGDEESANRTVVLERPASDPDEAFAGLVALLATRLDSGDDVGSAFDRVQRELAVDPVSSSSGRPRRGAVTPDPS
jgi:hypothetical protein